MHMRPYFAPRLAQPRTGPVTTEPVEAETLRAAWNVLVATVRPRWPGGQPTTADLHGLRRRLAHRFNLTEAEIEAVVSSPV